MPEKKYTFEITATVVDENGDGMFNSRIAYENMKYEDVVLVEGALLKMFEGLNQFAAAKVASTKHAASLKQCRKE